MPSMGSDVESQFKKVLSVRVDRRSFIEAGAVMVGLGGFIYEATQGIIDSQQISNEASKLIPSPYSNDLVQKAKESLNSQNGAIATATVRGNDQQAIGILTST